MNVLATQLGRIIIEAEISLANLDRLEQRLVTLHEVLQNENIQLSLERSELLAELWTMLGGNRREVYKLDSGFILLHNIAQYRTRALAHVVASLETLRSLGEDVEDLRERVAAPELVGDIIPVEVQISSIKSGLDRLTAKKYQNKQREQSVIGKVLSRIG